MSNFKKFFTILLVLMMAMTLVIPALADDAVTTTGTVTITNAIKGEKFSFYKVFDAYTFGDSYGYKVTESFRGYFTKNIVKNASGDTPTDDEIMVYMAGIHNDSSEAHLLADGLSKYATSHSISPIKEVTSKVDGSFTSNDLALAYGYYLMVPNIEGTNDVVFSLNKVQSNVSISNKLSVPTPYKYVSDKDEGYGTDGSETSYNRTGNVAAVGEEIDFTVIGKAPIMDGYQRYRFIIADTLENMEYVSGSAQLYINGNPVQISSNSGSEDGTVPVWIAPGSYQPPTESNQHLGGGKQEIRLHIYNLKTLTYIDSTTNTTQTVKFNDEIKFVYKAKLTNDCVLGSQGNANTVAFQYSNSPTNNLNLKTSTSATTKTYSLGISLRKVTSNGVALNGSKWKLEKVTGVSNIEGEAPKEIRTQISEIDGNIPNQELSTFSWLGLDDGTYYLTEVASPSSYQKLDKPIKLVISAITDDSNHTLYSIDSDPTAKSGYLYGNVSTNLNKGLTELSVKNFQPSELPSTGGAGLYIVAGVAIVALLGFGGTAMLKRKVNGED